MNKLAGFAFALLAVFIGLAIVYPDPVQRAFFTGAVKVNVLLLKYVHNVSATEQSLESMAVERLLRLINTTTVDVTLSRQNMENAGRLIPIPAGVTVERVNISRNDGTILSGYWLIPAEHHNKSAILYLHGGGFNSGSLRSHGGAAAEVARRVGARALLIEYRLAPEHQFPAPIDDALTAYTWLVFDQKYAANKTVIMGDSAGGGLVLLTLLALQDEAKGTIPTPAAGMTFSAWTDLSCERPSHQQNVDADALITEHYLTWAATLVTNTQPGDRTARKSHKVSPIFAPSDKLAKLPPLYMSVGGAEVLHDDTAHFAGKALQAGCDIKLVVTPHMQHNFAFFHEYFPEADRELTQVATWVKKQLRHK